MPRQTLAYYLVTTATSAQASIDTMMTPTELAITRVKHNEQNDELGIGHCPPRMTIEMEMLIQLKNLKKILHTRTIILVDHLTPRRKFYS